MSTPRKDNEAAPLDTFQIRLGEPDASVDLTLLEHLAEHLRAAFRALIREQTGEAKTVVRFAIQDARKGSLILDIRPEIEGVDAPNAVGVARTLIDDINRLSEGNPRTTIGANLLGHYRALVGVGQKAGRLELGIGEHITVLDKTNEVRIQAALKDQPEPDTQVVGYIETVNIHRRPWTFGLYTKLDRERVECRFADEMLDQVLRLMEEKALTEISGEGLFGPVGITPRTLELLEPPKRLDFDPAILKSYWRSSQISRSGESAAETVARIREERAKYA